MSNGVDIGTVIALIQSKFGGEIASAVAEFLEEYFEEHPEITVQDGSITYNKLHQSLKDKANTFDALGLSVVNGNVCQTFEE